MIMMGEKKPAAMAILDQHGANVGVRGEDGSDEGFDVAIEEFMEAVQSKDKEAAKAAFRTAFDILEMEPHREIDH